MADPFPKSPSRSVHPTATPISGRAFGHHSKSFGHHSYYRNHDLLLNIGNN